MSEPMELLERTLTHTSYCSVLQRGAFDRAEVCGCWCHKPENQPVHWVGDAPTSLHGNGASSFERTTRDAAAVTCMLCRTLLARGSADL